MAGMIFSGKSVYQKIPALDVAQSSKLFEEGSVVVRVLRFSAHLDNWECRVDDRDPMTFRGLLRF
jgi:hypothetical protein